MVSWCCCVYILQPLQFPSSHTPRPRLKLRVSVNFQQIPLSLLGFWLEILNPMWSIPVAYDCNTSYWVSGNCHRWRDVYAVCYSFNCQYILRVILLHELTACGSVSQLLSPGHCITIAYTCSCLNCILQLTMTCIWYKQQMVPSTGRKMKFRIVT